MASDALVSNVWAIVTSEHQWQEVRLGNERMHPSWGGGKHTRVLSRAAMGLSDMRKKIMFLVLESRRVRWKWIELCFHPPFLYIRPSSYL